MGIDKEPTAAPFIEKRLGQAVTLRIPSTPTGETLFDRLQARHKASLTNGMVVYAIKDGDLAPFTLDNALANPHIVVDPDLGPIVFTQAVYDSLSYPEWQEDLELLWLTEGRKREDVKWHEFPSQMSEVRKDTRYESMLEMAGYIGFLPIDLKASVDGTSGKGTLVIIGHDKFKSDFDFRFATRLWIMHRKKKMERFNHIVDGTEN